tara:strand:+ start:2507 stop:3136 length:630 start_codon:yes stop_codon:yes gene_type:complete
MVGRVIDSLIVFRILKMLTTPFEKQQAYKFGFIDKRGNRIKKIKDENGVEINNNPITAKEKASLTPLHRLVFNLKRLIEKVPFGKTAFASYAVALLLLKEETNLPVDQADELYEKFYKLLKDQNIMNAEMISEAIDVGKLYEDRPYRLRRQIKQNFTEDGEIKIYPEKTEITDVKEHSIAYGITIYQGMIDTHMFADADKVLFTAEDVY